MITGRHPRLNYIAIVVIVFATLLVMAPPNTSEKFFASMVQIIERLP